MIKFKKVWGIGFGSFVHETEFKLDRPGLNIIIAKNGSGKTTIFNLLNWILYGTSLKDVKDIATWDRFRDKNWKGTLGRLKFEKDGVKYEIIRCKKWKPKLSDGAKGADRLIILKNGLDVSPRDKKDRQAYINNLLGYNSGLFKNSILFGQKLKRLSQETGPEKKKVFEEAFESKFIKESRDKALLKLEVINGEFNELDHSIDTLTIKKDAAKKTYKQLKEVKTKFNSQHTAEVKKIKGKLKDIKTLLAEYSKAELMTKERKLLKAQNELKLLDNIAQEIEDLENREFREIGLGDDIQDRIDTQIKIMNEAHKQSVSVIKECSLCGQKIPKDKVEGQKIKIKEKYNQAKKERLKLSNQLEAQQAIRNDLLGKIDSKKKDKEKIISLTATTRILEREIIPLKTKYQNFEGAKKEKIYLNQRLEELDKETSGIKLKPIKAEILKHRKDIIKIKPRWKELKKDISNLKWAIDDVLGNKGLKTYIFDTMLKELNQLLKYYEQFVGYRIEFNVDFDSANKDIYTLCYIGEHPCFYEELSGAQSQLVDIATAFALNDLVTRDRPINIMVFDEVMDNLDEENEDIVNDLINNKALSTSIFLISHSIDLQNSSEKVIRMSYNKQNGQSVMKLL